MTDFTGITARNPILNASLNDGHDLIEHILKSGLSANPRLYANGVVVSDTHLYGVSMIPEKTQDNSDLPAWATGDWDGNTTLESLGLPATVAVYLQVWIGEKGNFYDVAQVQALLQLGVDLNKALF